MTETRDLLIEIGTEEMPPKLLAGLAAEFHDRLLSSIQDELDLIDPSRTSSHYYYSPRRLAVIFRDLRTQQPSKNIERSGPAV
ncbi:MAG: glycine--tRNA ligase subunit beta, partial [candidate division Zixibacteria bacterium]|nr:glycine--tRNA ligase subunit beta [candidate division Zixibacteria bacterium]NIW49305.1 glycine--tRNA ligase subunit beta [Gammaproteobacteria bacterium]NIX59084.1 glycine--tRNA ligase subunit beta [candidate division Zixibacteria bacterium]